MIEGQNDGDSVQALTVDSAATVLDGLLSDASEDQQPETPDDKTPEAQSSSKDAKGEESDASAEPSDSDEEDAEPSDEDGEGDEPDEQLAQPASHRLKVQGEEIEVTLDELKKGYSREKDYTLKAQKLADERRQHEAEVAPEREALRADRQRYASHLTELESALRSLAAEPDWDTLRKENPEQFADVWAAWDQHQKRIASIAQQRTAADALVAKDQEAQLKQHFATQREKLLEAIPAWSDKAVAKKESDDILAYGKTLGFSEDEVRGVTDHRALVALRKAMLFDRGETEKAAAKKTAQSKVEKVKTAAPGAKGAKPVTDATRAKQRHSKVGSVDSAARAIELMFGD